MRVERLKYILWAVDMERAIGFYTHLFEGKVSRRNEVMCDIEILGSTLGIHSGGEGGRTWTGLAFQVADLFEGCAQVIAHGGLVTRPPEDTPEEPAHLAMCVDSEGNEFMLTKARSR